MNSGVIDLWEIHQEQVQIVHMRASCLIEQNCLQLLVQSKNWHDVRTEMVECFNLFSDWNFNGWFSNLGANHFQDVFIVLLNYWNFESSHIQNICWRTDCCWGLLNQDWVWILNNWRLLDRLNGYIWEYYLRLNLWDIRPFFSDVNLNFSIRNDISDLIITSEFILIIILDPDLVIFLEFVFIDEFLNDKFSDLFDSFSWEDELELVEQGVGLSIVELNEEGTSVLVWIWHLIVF